MAGLPDVIEAERLFGEPDYLLRVLSKDLAAYQELYDTAPGSLPRVQRATSTAVMHQVKGYRSVPLD